MDIKTTPTKSVIAAIRKHCKNEKNPFSTYPLNSHLAEYKVAIDAVHESILRATTLIRGLRYGSPLQVRYRAELLRSLEFFNKCLDELSIEDQVTFGLL